MIDFSTHTTDQGTLVIRLGGELNAATNEYFFQCVQDEIEKNEQSLNKATTDMQAATQTGEGEKIATLSNIIHKSQSTIDALFEELENLTETFENKKQELDQQLNTLDET